MRLSDQAKNPQISDKELGTSKHDEIVLWMYEKLKDIEYVKKVFKLHDKELLKTDIVLEPQIKLGNYKAPAYMDIGLFAEWGEPVEVYLVDGDSYVYETLKTAELNNPKKKEIKKEIKYAIKRKTIYFEIKTDLNLGEVIRQINHIREFKGKETRGHGYARFDVEVSVQGEFVVVAPPNLKSSILIEQKIGFIPYNHA